MSGMNIRKLTDSLLKGAIKGMGPIGLPASMLLDSVDELMAAQKKEAEGPDYPSIKEIGDAVRQQVRQQAARDAWSKIEPACTEYFSIMGGVGPDGRIRPSDAMKLDELLRLQLGSSSDLRQGLSNIYDAQMSPSDMSTAEYGFPAYTLGASVEISLMIMEVPRIAKLNGKLEPADWEKVRRRIDEHSSAIDRMSRYISGFVIEKQLRDEMAQGRFQIGSPKIQQRQEELETQLLGGAGAARDLHMSFDRLSGLVRGQSKDDIVAQMNDILKTMKPA